MAYILYVAAQSPERARIVKRLRNAGLDVHVASSGREASVSLRVHTPALCCVDITTLRGDPHHMMKRLRRSSPGTAFILITGGNPIDSLPPADGYLRKPFTTRTFKTRMRQALANRDRDTLHVGVFELDVRLRRLSCPNGTYHLTPVETRLMREFMERPKEVLSREYLVRSVWETDYMGDTRTLDVHIHWLRRKIEDDLEDPRYLVTVYGVGYIFHPRGMRDEQGEE